MKKSHCLAISAVAGLDEAWHSLVAEEGWAVSQYYGITGRAQVTCRSGHERVLVPLDLLKKMADPNWHGLDACRECAEPNLEEINTCRLHERAAAEGVTLVKRDDGWGWAAVCDCGTGTYPVSAHIYRDRPQLKEKCFTCQMRSNSPEIDWFYRQAEAEGVTVDRWPTGPNQGTDITCQSGHQDRTNAMKAFRRGVVCRYCTGSVHLTPFTVFYVVQHPDTRVVKFGVSRGSGESRLRQHAEDGYTTRHRKLADLPGNLAKEAEDHCKAVLAAAGWSPVRGAEWFEGKALPLLLDTADTLLSDRAGILPQRTTA